MTLDEAGVQLIAAGVASYISDINKADSATTGFYGTLGNSDKSANGFQQVITGALRHVGAALVDFGIQGAKAIGGFVKDSIGLAGDFEANMLQFQSVAGKDVDTSGLEKFRDLFLDIGKRLPVSTSEVQQAAIEMVKGGIDPATIAAGGLEQNIQFAAAAMGGDLVKAAEISSKILGGWAGVNATAAEKADFLTHATDLLTKAANASSTDVEGLSRGIFQSQGIAKAAGVQFDDLVTTLAELAPRFGSSAEAGTSLKNLIARLQPTTKNATAAMIDLGLMTEEGKNKFFDATGTFIGFQQASELLKGSVEGLTDKQKALELQMIFGNDAMSAASALSELGAAGYTNMADALDNANGVAAAAALKQQGFNTALDNAKGSVEALQITIGSALLPVLTDLMNNVVAPAVNTLTDLASALFGDQEAFDKLSPTMQGVAISIQGFVDDLTNGIEVAKGIAAEIEQLIGVFSSASSSSSELGSAIDDLNGVWQLALKTIQDVAGGYVAIVQAALPIVQGFIDEHGTQISAFFKTTWDSIIKIVTLALQLYDAIVPPILHAIAGFIEDHGSEIQKILGGAWDAITSLITGTLQTIEGVIQLALDLIHGDWAAAWDDIGHIVDVQATAIEGFIGGFLDMIAGLFDTSMADISQTWVDNWNMLVEIVSNIDWAQVGSDVVAGIIDGIDSAASSLYSTLRNLASDALQAAKDALGISSPSTEFMPVGALAIQGVIVGMESTVPALMNVIDQTGSSMIAALTKNIEEGGDAIRAKMDALIKDVESISSQLQDAISDAFGATVSIDRQKLSNLKAVAELPEQTQAGVQSQINVAEQIATAMNDPQQAAEFFKLRSKQLIELAKLNDQIMAATDDKQRAYLLAQRDLVNAANIAELGQFNATIEQGSTTKDIAEMMQKLLSNKDLPGILDNPVIAQLFKLLGQLQSQPMSGFGALPGAQTNNMQTTNLNMPIYTNQSPQVIQSSLAIAGAVLP